MAHLFYITHPQVVVELHRPVHEWGLSELGRRRAQRMLRQPWVANLGRVVSSAETKAMQTAAVLGEHLGLVPEIRPRLGENDRSATGPLPRDEFEQLADRFFSHPHESVRGWERAVDAQARIAAELTDLLDHEATRDVAVVGHGGVGTLWYCHLAKLPIDRCHDQPSQGHYFTVDLANGRPLHAYRSIDPVP